MGDPRAQVTGRVQRRRCVNTARPPSVCEQPRITPNYSLSQVLHCRTDLGDNWTCSIHDGTAARHRDANIQRTRLSLICNAPECWGFGVATQGDGFDEELRYEGGSAHLSVRRARG